MFHQNLGQNDRFGFSAPTFTIRIWSASSTDVFAPAQDTVRLDLTHEEAALLERSLHNHLAELRHEIAATHDSVQRLALTDQEHQLRSIWIRVGDRLTASDKP